MNKNHAKLLLKLIFIIAALAFVFSKVEFEAVISQIKSVSPFYLLLAYILLVVAQIISSFRFSYYLETLGVSVNRLFCIGFYFAGMLCNTILPGGIGGDGYKVYFLKKHAYIPAKSSIRLIISDRASGLLWLLLLAYGAAYISAAHNMIIYFNYLLLVAVFSTIIGYLFSVRLLLKESLQTALGASVYSFFVQIISLLIVFAILKGMGVDDGYAGYGLLFLISSVLSIIPISIGGIGIRELTFIMGAAPLGLDADIGVAIGLIYFVINLICSLNGLFFWHRLEKLYK